MARAGDSKGEFRPAKKSDHGHLMDPVGDARQCGGPEQEPPEELAEHERTGKAGCVFPGGSGTAIIQDESGIETIDFQRSSVDLELLLNPGRPDSVNSPRLPEFQEKLWGTSHEDEAMVVALPNGGFMLVWHTVGEDENNRCCFACQYVDVMASGRRA